jgi:ornithine carbamoyltransferase
MNKDFLSVSDFNKADVMHLIRLAIAMKNQTSWKTAWDENYADGYSKSHDIKGRDKHLSLIFDKPSLRTRVSFERAMQKLGGSSTFLSKDEIQIGKREEIKDVARTLSKMTDVIAIRTTSHNDLKEFANFSTVPVINALSDLEHPCQALADLMTIYEKFGKLDDVNFTYLGDANNVSNSLAIASSLVGMSFTFCGPIEFSLNDTIIDQCHKLNSDSLQIVDDPSLAVKDADVLYTDVWASMGDETSIEERRPLFLPYQLNSDLLNITNKKQFIMHCLPAKRGNEITDEVIESENSIVFQQAENRLWIQEAIMNKLINRY